MRGVTSTIFTIPGPVQGYLLNFGSVQAFQLFFVLGGVGSLAILLNFGLPFLPIATVVLYGGLLWLGQSRHFTQLNPVTKDSPYFLGFILTLIALIRIFAVLADPSEAQNGISGFLFDGTATALGTTIAGLIFRQLIHATDPVEHDRDDLFQTLAQELKDQTTTFARSQRRLVELIEEFTSSRESLLSREEAATRRYITSLEESGLLVGRAQAEYAVKVGDSLEALRGTSEAAGKAAAETASRLKQAGEVLAQTIASHQKTLSETQRSHHSLVEQAKEALLNDTKHMQEGTAALSESIRVVLKQIQALPEDHEAVVSGVTRATEDLTKPLGKIRRDLEEIHAAMTSLSTGLAQVPAKLDSTLGSLNEVLAGRSEDVDARLGTIISDLEAIDRVVDQLVKVLERRISPAAR